MTLEMIDTTVGLRRTAYGFCEPIHINPGISSQLYKHTFMNLSDDWCTCYQNRTTEPYRRLFCETKNRSKERLCRFEGFGQVWLLFEKVITERRLGMNDL